MINHIAIIMDGNRRWAKERLLPSIAGYKAGFDNLQKILLVAKIFDIKYLTVWALSMDNLNKRGQDEIDGIIKLINSSKKLTNNFLENGVKIKIIGNIDKLPGKSVEILKGLEEITKDNNDIILTIALVYGGQDEIVRGIKKFIKDGGDIEKINKETFRNYLDTSFLPSPELIIRTGGDIRHSGFLLYDSEYSEYYFTEKKWPEFDENELKKAIDFLNKSKRNFGR